MTIVEQDQAQLDLEIAEERFRLAFAEAPIGIALVAPDGQWLRVNRSLCDIVGYSEDELLGGRFQDITHTDDLDADLEKVRQMLAGEIRSYQMEKRYFHRDGHTVWIRLSVSLVHDPASGDPLYFISHIEDITDRRRAVDELDRRREALERSNEELEQFAYVASHDLLEPLRVIRGFVELLQKRYQGHLDEDGDRFIGFTIDGVERMQDLIDSLLAYSRVGRSEPKRETVDTQALVYQALAPLRPRLEEIHGEIQVGELPQVTADPVQLQQLFANLIGNAVKFTDGDEPRIVVAADKSDGDWVFSVADNGPGIAERDSERIFEMFKRLHGRSVPGTGIGLAICKRIAEHHGGRIWVESQPGHGSTFRFTMPSGSQAGDPVG